MLRVCPTPGCPNYTNGGPCRNCQRQRDKARGTRQQRGYDATHERTRKQTKKQVDQGNAHCWRCGTWLSPTEPWHLGHDDYDRSLYRGPECVPCSAATAGR